MRMFPEVAMHDPARQALAHVMSEYGVSILDTPRILATLLRQHAKLVPHDVDALAQIVLAQFNNVDGLESIGNSLYRESRASGVSFIGTPGEGGRGKLTSGGLEQSNVDLATELTKIITGRHARLSRLRALTRKVARCPSLPILSARRLHFLGRAPPGG